jgi:multidrug resistance efflux pump
MSPQSNRSRKRRLVLLAVLGVGLAGYLALRIREAHQPFEWSGTIEAHTMDVGSRVGGRVDSVEAREGDLVAAGQALVVLEKGELPAQRLQALGQLEQAQAALQRVSGQALSSERRAQVDQARARLRAGEAAEDQARLEARRTRILYEGGAGTRAARDDAELALRNAAAQTAALRAQLDTLLAGTPADVKSASGQVDAAEGRVQQIDVMLRELVIRSPAAARVESLDLRPGDILAPNQPAVRLLEPDELFLRLYVPETQIGRVRPGLEVPIEVDSFPDRTFRGRVEAVAHQGEFTPRNLQTADERADEVFATRVRILEGKDVLRAGMAATVRVRR